MKKHIILISLVLVCFFIDNFNLYAQDKVLQELEEFAIIDQKIKFLREKSSERFNLFQEHLLL